MGNTAHGSGQAEMLCIPSTSVRNCATSVLHDAGRSMMHTGWVLQKVLGIDWVCICLQRVVCWADVW